MLVRSGLLGGLEPLAGKAVQAGLKAAGVDVRSGVQATDVVREAGMVVVTLDNGQTLECDELLAAAGRRPKTDDLGLETVGLRPGSWLDVDDTCQVTAVDGGWLYAAGDVNHRALLTHMGKYQARVCAAAIVARAQKNRNCQLSRTSRGRRQRIVRRCRRLSLLIPKSPRSG